MCTCSTLHPGGGTIPPSSTPSTFSIHGPFPPRWYSMFQSSSILPPPCPRTPAAENVGIRFCHHVFQLDAYGCFCHRSRSSGRPEAVPGAEAVPRIEAEPGAEEAPVSPGEVNGIRREAESRARKKAAAARRKVSAERRERLENAEGGISWLCYRLSGEGEA